MRTNAVLLTLSLLGAGLLVPDPARADNILIQNRLAKWKLGNVVANPLPVEVKKGDVLEFKVTGQHGVVTIDKPVDPSGDQIPSPVLELVLACGEDSTSKPNYVLREVECGASTQFNKELTGPMKLEVTDKFQNDLHFWCIIHTAGMWGTIKLKPKP